MTEELGAPLEPTYIPEGYYEVYRDEFENNLTIAYENDEMLAYYFSRKQNIDDSSSDMDNEKCVMEEMEWKSGKAIYFRPLHDNISHDMMWEESGYIYTVSSDVSKEEMLKFAEGVK